MSALSGVTARENLIAPPWSGCVWGLPWTLQRATPWSSLHMGQISVPHRSGFILWKVKGAVELGAAR